MYNNKILKQNKIQKHNKYKINLNKDKLIDLVDIKN